MTRAKLPRTSSPTYIVRHRFWRGENEWLVLQIGPGVATVNFTAPYSWQAFRQEALFLRDRLLQAYEGVLPRCQTLVLRYRNTEAFDYRSEDVLSFLSTKLNTEISLPRWFPGVFASTTYPSALSYQSSYELREPKGRANVILATAERPDSSGKEAHQVLWQIEVLSESEMAPDILDQACFSTWLDSAHTAIHEWFMAFVDGSLLKQYSVR